MKFFQVKTVSETMRLIEENCTPLNKFEQLNLQEAFGKVLFEDVFAKENVPAFSRSSVDGYAVCSSDTFGASDNLPSFFTIVGTISMGENVTQTLKKGEAMFVPTGGMLPEGADAVVMIEYCENIEDMLTVYMQVAPLENVIQIGEDFKLGELCLGRGITLSAKEIGTLAAVGAKKVLVSKSPTVTYISTGDEIVPYTKDHLPLGKIRNINEVTVGTLLKQWGCNFLNGGIVSDDPKILEATCRNWLEKSDFLIISGGSSVGTKDFSEEVIGRLGAPGVYVHGISTKPGKPTILANADGKPVLGLPGHPAAAMIIFQLLGKKITDILKGVTKTDEQIVMAKSNKRIASAVGRTDFIRVKLTKEKDSYFAEPIYGKSGLISTLAKCDGIMIIPEQKEGIIENEIVEVLIM